MHKLPTIIMLYLNSDYIHYIPIWFIPIPCDNNLPGIFFHLPIIIGPNSHHFCCILPNKLMPREKMKMLGWHVSDA